MLWWTELLKLALLVFSFQDSLPTRGRRVAWQSAISFYALSWKSIDIILTESSPYSLLSMKYWNVLQEEYIFTAMEGMVVLGLSSALYSATCFSCVLVRFVVSFSLCSLFPDLSFFLPLMSNISNTRPSSIRILNVGGEVFREKTILC
mgnify:CR=1 FL=1